jgi:hypothetical protein
MSTLYQNFNFNPVETSVKTSNYTIPAGRYARVTPIAATGGTHGSAGFNANVTAPNFNLQINSVVAHIYPCSGQLKTSTTSVVTLTFPSNGFVSYNFFTPNGAPISDLRINGVSNGAGANNASVLGYATCSSIGMQGAFSTNTSLIASWVFQTNPLAIFVKSGDVISLNGASSYVTEEYNQIS